MEETREQKAARLAARAEEVYRKIEKKFTFEQWKEQVNRVLEARLGLSADDLPDWDYRSAYDDGILPTVAATRAMRAAEDF